MKTKMKFLIGGIVVLGLCAGYWQYIRATDHCVIARGERIKPAADSKPAASVMARDHSAKGEGAFAGVDTELPKPNQQNVVAASVPLQTPLSAGSVSDGMGVSKTREAGGEPANAAVCVGDSKYNLEPNAWGLYPRVVIPAESTVQVTLAYPDGQINDSVVIQAEDGGNIDRNKTVQAMSLDDSKAISFEFKADGQDGVYRVTVRKGLDQKRLEFWVGPEPALQSVASTKQ